MARSIITKTEMQPTSISSGPRSPTVSQKPLAFEQTKNSRSPQFVKAIQSLDLGSRTLTSTEIDQLKNQIAAEIGGPIRFNQLLGIMARCRLGPEYHVHSLGLALNIIKHYKLGDPVEAEMAAAIPHALQSSYSFIEIYADRLVCVYPDGTTTEIKK